MIPADLRDVAARIEADLRRNILPFWSEHVVDRAAGTFVGSLTNDLVADRTVERGALLTSRLLWTFAAASRAGREPAWLEVADLAQADLMTRFHDGRNGGFFWSIGADGAVLQDRKQIYGQAFAIYALTEYHAATGRRAPLDHAIATFRLLERHARDRRHGGYFEAFARDWSPIADVRLSDIDQNDPKSQNTMLHVMEAYTNLLRVWPDPELHAALAELVGVMLDRVVDAATAHLGLFFSEDWKRRSDRISYGHDIEASWLLTEAAAVLGDPALLARTRQLAGRIADVTLAEGIDADGGVFNLGSPAGLVDANKEWWPQAEAVVGFLNAHEISGDDRYLAAALRSWDFIARHLIDRNHGEWFRGVTRDGKVIASFAKVSFWKCPYHNGRMALEAGRRLRSIRAARTGSPAL
ncbi:MAG TPA: AGE family epimerase/isomerase [Lacunisphaera sp.]|nr:AGE family epimerase/isomerase [Lacunisphaera sp.]